MRRFIVAALIVASFTSFSQAGYWQQRADYKMDIELNVETNQYKGLQVLTYTNNSPDTLFRVFYHLNYNAFQPNSMMDIYGKTKGFDHRFVRQPNKLKPNEIGYHKVKSLKQNGDPIEYKVVDTILEVDLAVPIPPGTTTTFDMEFDAQVPLICRRGGRDNTEGIRYSMSQWYPKIAHYDKHGWQAHPYMAYEFYSPFGDYEVNITIDKKYVLGGTGVLQNPNEIGFGYEDEGVKVQKVKGPSKTWKFKAENVIDFAWAADPKYQHIKRVMKDGTILRFFYVKGSKTENWEYLPELTEKTFELLEARVGEYPYPVYSVIQAGHGGMEYPMATLLTGHRSMRSLVGTTVHEAAHSWFQGILATDERHHPWMDEGFTNFVSAPVMAELFDDIEPTTVYDETYAVYSRAMLYPNYAEPMTIHSDHYFGPDQHNFNAYTKGAIILSELRYLMGLEAFDRLLKNYYNLWKFKHPDPDDFKRVAEKTSGLELDWYFEYMVNTTRYADYSVADVSSSGNESIITLKREGMMPMPIDLRITMSDGTTENIYIPLDLLRGEKETNATIYPDWFWINPSYELKLARPIEEIQKVEIDPSGLMADVNLANNRWVN